MKFKIVFSAAEKESRHEAAARFVISRKPKPTRSLVLIHFPARNMTLSYYNDQFDLHGGDLVFVDGKLEGFRGHVVDVCYTFKIKLSDYKRVISVADTKVHGEFLFAGSHFVTFDRSALPYEQVITWFKAPEKEDTEIVSEQDGSGFQLNDLQTMKISDAIAERGHDYYRENRVRYISLLDGIDTGVESSANDITPFRAIMNDMYAKDISKKICSTMKNKRLRGDYIGNYAPYGYLKDENNRSRLVIDHEIAPIVVEIFELRAKGIGFDTICRILNEKGYPSPGRLRYERSIITNNNKKGSELPWNRHVLKDLLVNVVYIGNLAQGRSSQCLYKGEKYHWTKEADWDVVEGTHEPIISMELWNTVQEINKKVSSNAAKSFGRYAHLPKRPNPYGSVLRCADCGRVMKYVRSYSRPKKDGVVTDYYNYKCPTNIELGDTACSKKSIRADDLDKIVLSVIRKQMDLFLDTQKTLLGLIALEKEKAKHSVPANRVKELQDKLDQKKKLFSRLYIDFKDGILTQQEYLLARDVYQKEISAYESELQELQAIKTKTKVTETGARKWNRLISRYYKTKTVTEEMVEAMVDEIRVNTDGSLDIRFKYMPEFEEMFKECERIRKEVA